MSVQEALDSLSVSPIFASRLISALGLQPYELDDPVRFGRLEDVVRNISSHPDPWFLIGKITSGKQVDRLDHVWGYLELSSRLARKAGEMEEASRRHETILRFAQEKGSDPESMDDYRDSVSAQESIARDMAMIRGEMAAYEK